MKKKIYKRYYSETERYMVSKCELCVTLGEPYWKITPQKYTLFGWVNIKVAKGYMPLYPSRGVAMKVVRLLLTLSRKNGIFCVDFDGHELARESEKN